MKLYARLDGWVRDFNTAEACLSWHRRALRWILPIALFVGDAWLLNEVDPAPWSKADIAGSLVFVVAFVMWAFYEIQWMRAIVRLHRAGGPG